MKANIKIDKDAILKQIEKIFEYKVAGIYIVKNFLFFVLFLVVTLISIATIIAPSIKSYKKTQKEYLKTKALFEATKDAYEKKLKKLNRLKLQNAKIIHVFRREFDQESFKNFLSKYMQVVSIEKNQTKPYKLDFLKTSYFLKTKIDSPKNFYDFVEDLKRYKYLIRVYFPIDFTKDNDKIDLTFKIEHYRLKDLKAEKSSKYLKKEQNLTKNLIK